MAVPSTPTAPKGEITTVELSRGERTVGRRAAEIRATVPQLELQDVARVGDTDEERLTARLLAACARALRVVPHANGSHRGDALELYSRVNIGLTVAEEDVHVIPTVFDADTLDVDELAGVVARLRSRARGGELTPPELAGATFTISRTRARSGSPLVIAPQAAAVCAGAGRNGEVVLSAAYDHRILYGARAEAFLETIREQLEGNQ